MEGHKFLAKAIIKKNLSFNAETKQGPYFLRRVHVFWNNECILEMDVTGFIHSIVPLANVGEISIHIDAGTSLDQLAPKGIKSTPLEKKHAKHTIYEKVDKYHKESKMKFIEIYEQLLIDFAKNKIISEMIKSIKPKSLSEGYRRWTELNKEIKR